MQGEALAWSLSRYLPTGPLMLALRADWLLCPAESGCHPEFPHCLEASPEAALLEGTKERGPGQAEGLFTSPQTPSRPHLALLHSSVCPLVESNVSSREE